MGWGRSSVAGLGYRGHLANLAIAVRSLEQVGKILGKMSRIFPSNGIGSFLAKNIYIYYVRGIDFFSLFHFGIGIFKPKVSGD